MLRKDLDSQCQRVLDHAGDQRLDHHIQLCKCYFVGAIPYENPSQLVRLFETFRKEKIERRSLSYPNYRLARPESSI